MAIGNTNNLSSSVSTFYNTTTAATTYRWADGTGTISEYIIPDYVRLSYNTAWVSANTDFFKKRRRFLGKGSEKLEAKTFFKILKKGLKREVKKKFQQLAEKAFDEALKAEKIGADRVKGELEKHLTFFLKKAAIQASGYDTYVEEEMIEKYKDHLPKNKELVIDEISEYEKPLPNHAQVKLERAKKEEIFDSFWIFWIREVKDPILFGQIKDEPKVYYFIDQWDNDIKVEDLLKYKK